MASIQTIFDKVVSGSTAFTQEMWIDLGAIPTGKKIYMGYATLGSEDKPCQFALRTNKSGKSAGTVADTTIHDWSFVAAESSLDRDLYYAGDIQTISIESTGVEHFWLHVKSQVGASGAIDYFIHYAEY